MDSLIVQTVIGVVFAFAAFALLISTLTEAIARFMGLRGEYLLRGLRSLLDNDRKFELKWSSLLPRRPRTIPGRTTPPERRNTLESGAITPQLLSKTFLAGFADHGSMPTGAGAAVLSNSERRALPSYISGQSFAQAIIDLLVPVNDTTSMTQIRTVIKEMEPSPLKQALDGLAATVEADITAFRAGIEQWYDDQMSRVSGWYKRHTRWITLVLGAIVVLAFNVNALTITRTLYSDQALRESVVTQAFEKTDCPENDPVGCLKQLRGEIADSVTAGLPIGWGTVPACEVPDATCEWYDSVGLTDPEASGGADLAAFLLTLLGWAVMVLVLLPGARYWFDLLGRLGSLRSTGGKPKA